MVTAIIPIHSVVTSISINHFKLSTMAVSATEADAARQSGISNKSHEENIETRREVGSTGSHSEDEASVTPKVINLFIVKTR